MRVLHVLPHPGGGAETYLDLLDRLDGAEQVRFALASGKTPAEGARSIPRRWPALARAARRVDVLHAHGDMASVLALPLLRARPSVWTPQGLHALRRLDGPAGAAFRTAVRGVVGATAATLCSSESEREDLVAAVPAVLHGRLRVIVNGTDVVAPAAEADRRAARRALGVPEEGPVALYLAELDARKDPLTAARAAAAAGVPLLVAGEGPLRGDLEALAAPGVHVLGFRRDVERLLTAADMFLLPSSREGMSLSLMEAMGHGLALLVADGAGNPETVGDAGLVLPFGDEQAWTEALVALRDDGGRRAALGDAARERARHRFSVERFVDAVGAAYRDATSPGRGAAAASA